MAIALDTFEQGVALKRKRSSEESYECLFDQSRHHKRTNSTQLPIRTSPSLRHEHLWQNTVPALHQPLTPVDSSDEERCGSRRLWSRRRQSPSPTQRQLHLYNPPILMVQDDTMNEYDNMNMNSISSPTTANSNFPSPLNRYLSAPATSTNDRAPTPIRANFRKLENTTRGRHLQFARPSILSPVMAEDQCLPSPAESDCPDMITDAETTMRMEHASSGFGALTVACDDDEMMDDQHEQENIENTNPARNMREKHGRNARLHMGFRADCEKCQQRVPGHYSHIIWE